MFHKRPIPDDEEGKQELCQKLQKFDVSIAAYDAALSEEPVYMYGMLAQLLVFVGYDLLVHSRMHTERDGSPMGGVRRSPRKHGPPPSCDVGTPTRLTQEPVDV